MDSDRELYEPYLQHIEQTDADTVFTHAKYSIAMLATIKEGKVDLYLSPGKVFWRRFGGAA